MKDTRHVILYEFSKIKKKMHIFQKILFTKKRRVKVFIFYLLLKIEAINYYLTNFYQHRPSGLLKNANILVKKRQNDTRGP